MITSWSEAVYDFATTSTEPTYQSLEAVIDYMRTFPLCGVGVSENQKYVDVDLNYCNIVQATPSQIIGKPIDAFVGNEDLLKARTVQMNELEGHPYTWSMVDSNGDKFTAEAVCVCLDREKSRYLFALRLLERR